MNILITNDDGLHFDGLTALAECLQPDHNVFISAPSTEKSGTSSALSIYDDIFVELIDEKTIMVEGFPVDCINIALHGEVFPVKFDLVLSGINKGVNMGEDVIYSGTVGAARHAFIHQYDSIAVSCGYLSGKSNFRRVAEWLRNFLDSELYSQLPRPFLLNINYPEIAINQDDPKIKWTKMGRRIYRDSYKRSKLAGGGTYFNLGGSELDFHLDPETDFSEYQRGNISITPLQLDTTDYGKLQQFKRYDNPEPESTGR